MEKHLGIRSIAISIGLTAVITAPSFIRADGDDGGADPAANITVLSNSQRGNFFNNQTLDRFLNDARGPKQKELNKNPDRQNGGAQDTGMEQDQTQSNQPTPVWLMRSSSLKRAAALRLTEKGRYEIQAGEYEKAVSSLEKALSVEANPYIYFYLAEVHYQLGHYQESLNFLEVAESWLMQQPDWAPHLVALKGQIPGSGITQYTMRSADLALR